MLCQENYSYFLHHAEEIVLYANLFFCLNNVLVLARLFKLMKSGLYTMVVIEWLSGHVGVER